MFDDDVAEQEPSIPKTDSLKKPEVKTSRIRLGATRNQKAAPSGEA